MTLSPVPGQSGSTGNRSLRGPPELEDDDYLWINCLSSCQYIPKYTDR